MLRMLFALGISFALTASAAGKKPKKAPAVSTGIDETAIDAKAKPCDDFYQYACGNWIERTQIPADQPAWYRSFNEIRQRNEDALHTLLEKVEKTRSFAPDPYGDKVADYYGACMDEAAIEKGSEKELGDLLKQVDAIQTIPQLTHELAMLHLGVGHPLFGIGSEQDFKDATRMIARVDQAGLGLPDRDYYLKDDAKMKELRAKYLEHMQRMLTLANLKDSTQTIMAIEMKLAQASMSRVDRRDPKKVYHRLDLAGLEKQAPHIPWKQYLNDLGHAEIKEINVAVPAFFTALDEIVTKTPMQDLKSYLRWHVVHRSAHHLPKKFVDEDFNFYGKTLSGQEQLPPRWKRCVRATDEDLGMALARPFVRESFGAEGKATTLDMVRAIESAMHGDLDHLDWMDEPSRKAALEKLAAIANKIGYPDNWRNYDKLEVSKDSYLLNAVRANTFETNRELNKVGKPVDRTEWLMTPPTVNAYYEPSMNEMVFPAGILQTPFYANSAAQAVNFGAIGMVMGHELTHGFDDEGRQFDGQGNLREWWTPGISKEFDKRAECVVKQYDGYVAIDDIHVNGKLTLGENLADLGGIKLAHAAWKLQPQKPAGSKFTDEQLFYLGYAQAWCAKKKPELARMRAVTDPHSPSEWRVNGPLSNVPDFAAAFQCKPGDKMVRAEQCKIW